MARALYLSDYECSDGESEAFISSTTLRNIEQRSLPPKHVHSVSYTTVASDEEDCNESLKITEMHSSPDILTEKRTLETVSSATVDSDEEHCSECSNIIETPLSPDILTEKYTLETVSYTTVASDEEFDESLKIMEIHSSPDILTEKCTPQPNTVSKLNASPQIDSSLDINLKDICLQVEKLVADLCKNTKVILGNISKEPSPCRTEIQNANETVENIDENFRTTLKQPDWTNSLQILPVSIGQMRTPESISTAPEIHTPAFISPISASKSKFQTPSTKKSFQHVLSPVATYINRSPLVPLIQDVKPKRTLLSSSAVSIPNKRAPKPNLIVKELPRIAYKTAKETKMIDISDEEKLPQSKWAKQLASSISKVTVVKHKYRKGVSVKKPLKPEQEDSIADLPMHQADTSSVCAKKCIQ